MRLINDTLDQFFCSKVRIRKALMSGELLALNCGVVSVISCDLDGDKPGLEDLTLLLATAIFLVSCPAEVVSTQCLLSPCIQIFLQAWQNEQVQVRYQVNFCLLLAFLHCCQC